MKLKILFASLFGMILYSSLNAQGNELKNLDLRLSQSFDDMIIADYKIRYDSLAPSFKNLLVESLEQSKTTKLQLDSLSTRIKVVKSENENLSFYSWDERSGGSWHTITVIAQFITNNRNVKIREIGGNEGETGDFTDAIIYEIHELMIEDKLHYLTFGWGTHGGGHHHVIAQIFRIEGDELINCKSCFEMNENLIIQATRGKEINLTFHPENMQLTHNEFIRNEDLGFYMPGQKVVVWELKEGKFIR